MGVEGEILVHVWHTEGMNDSFGAETLVGGREKVRTRSFPCLSWAQMEEQEEGVEGVEECGIGQGLAIPHDPSR